MDFTINELRQLLKYCTTDRNSTRVNTEHFKFVTKLMDKLRGKFKKLDIQDVSLDERSEATVCRCYNTKCIHHFGNLCMAAAYNCEDRQTRC